MQALAQSLLEEKKFVIVITSYNNAEWFERNVGCLFTQLNNEGTGLYENYRIIYIDDCSPDGTAELVEKFIISENQQHRVTLIKNKTRKRALANIYYALQLCQPDEIVFNYDGDDWLANDYIFARINENLSKSGHLDHLWAVSKLADGANGLLPTTFG